MLKNGVSRHTLPSTLPFSVLGQLFTLVREADDSLAVLLGTVGDKLVLSVKEDVKRKRGREEEVESVDKKIAGLEGTKEELDKLRSVLVALSAIRGTGGEQAVQGVTVEKSNLTGSDRFVVAVRFHAGVAVKVKSLKEALGDAWSDGAITTEESLASLPVTFPSLTDEGVAALDVGSVSFVLVSAVGSVA